MRSANNGWLFYKKMFFNYPNNIKETANEVLKAQKTDYVFPQASHNNIRLKTVYPGLVVGSGYPHSMKGQSDNFDFGFYFDYTSGMPVIPASTVKGMLRSYFGQNKNEKYKEQKEGFIRTLLNEMGVENVDVVALFNEIFEGLKWDEKTKRYEPIPMYERDIFYDAYVVKGYSKSAKDKTYDDVLFADDSITPHYPDLLKDPTPNRMLKIAPDVTWQFNFDLKDGIIAAEQKEELFKELLLWGGIGAKTNVGYGQFEQA